MAELNLNQIEERLNAEFTGEGRTLVFWYDDRGEFAEDVASVKLSGAEIFYLKPDNQFYAKYFLEYANPAKNYLIYAPFPKPRPEDNHLEDTLLYSKRFYADRAALLCADLGVDERYKPVMERHIDYFREKNRLRRFYDVEIDAYDEETITVGLMSAICRLKVCSFEEVVRAVLMEGTSENPLTEETLSENPFLTEMEKYGLTASFWNLCGQRFGYRDEQPTLARFAATLFVTRAGRQLSCDVPEAWTPFVSRKSGNVIAFTDNLMNNVLYGERYDALSEYVSGLLRVPDALEALPPEALLDCDAFAAADDILIRWITERLAAEDVGAKLNGFGIPEICEKRAKTHYADKNRTVYELLNSAYRLISAAHYVCPDSLKEIAEQYQNQDYLLDAAYRTFYFCYDRIGDTEALRSLRALVENIYVNEYLSVLLPKWNQALQSDDITSVLRLQRNFYRDCVKRAVKTPRDRVVVIISDAMRYEVGRELFQKLLDDPRCTVKLSARLSVLPSVTRLGMAALLPHKSLAMTDDYKILADDILCDSLVAREKVLQKHMPHSRCVQYDDIKDMNTAELRGLVAGNNVIYVYHNQIDARGDKPNTEDEVFAACREAVQEIYALIHALSSRANTQHCFVTSDHGFLYRRDEIRESDKINVADSKEAYVNRRFIVSKSAVAGEGVASVPMSRILGNDDGKTASFPIGANVFKTAGGGQNFVHGGSSPQETLVPVLDIRTEKGRVASVGAKLVLVSLIRKITTLSVTMDFIQAEPVGDTVKSATYRIFFISEDNRKISSESVHVADSREKEARKRIFSLRFTFKNQRYDKGKQYYLVATNEDGEALRHPVFMDIAASDDSSDA